MENMNPHASAQTAMQPAIQRTIHHRRHRGFAAMDHEKARKIQSAGGKAVSQNRQHMAEIGRKGGQTIRQSQVLGEGGPARR